MYLNMEELLKNHNLKLIYMDMKEPGFYYPKAKMVVLNEKLHESTSEAFHLAHELGHFIASHFEYAALYTSPTFHSKFEMEANKIAIALLLNIFIENELTDESQFKLDKFMDFYSINKKLRETCFEVCQSYFKNNYPHAV
ncbi:MULTISPECIES: ImmA/IrrE family metallo-endopeptidase [unclassified Enterococcus]|jgi:Zn-dependent peptidase ImmA (M78 family)|uniref:ImmA/IrrE family metallo-endopeptidase n=1 Tax=unclassified Enterococcus TaxID=2608891 RepID=UPI003D293245